MKIAIAGLGKAASQGHLPAIAQLASDGASLVSAADPDPKRLAQMETTLVGVPLFESAEAMLGSIRCDVLVVAAHPAAHAELIALALDSGVHVICEKPLVVTRARYETVARRQARSQRALISVHQYRYATSWILISRVARIASRLRMPFSLTIDVERPALDPTRLSPWRTEIETSGGMLADHGAHCLSLAWTIDPYLDLLTAARSWDNGTERTAAAVRLGSGLLELRLFGGAAARRGRIELCVGALRIVWADDRLALTLAGRRICSRRVAALRDRNHVDALYVSFYRDIAANLPKPAWQAHRTAETLSVGRALIELLESAA